MAADYTRNIVFNVNDKAIKRATDRITRSLTNIEKTLQRIERKGFNNLAKSAETASKQITNTNKNVAIAQKRIQLLGNAGKEIGGVYQKSFGKVFSTFDKLLPIVSETKETIRVLSRNAKRDLDLITFATKASGQGISKLVELFKQGQVSAITFVTGVSAIISKTKEFGSVAITNLTTLGRLIEQNTKKAGTLVNVLGFKTGIISQPLNLFQNTQAAFEKNTLLARQNAMRGNVGRNIGRSQAARRDSDFLGFSQDADFVTRTSGQSRRITSAMMQSFARPLGADGSPFIGPLFDKNTFVSRVGRPAGFRLDSPQKPGFQDPTAKAIRRNFLKEKKANKEIRNIKAGQLRLERAQNRALKERVVTTQELAKTTKTAGGSAAQRQGFFRGGARGAIGSAAIGGGFPLLFGQGALGAIGGGVGGALGGAIGGQFGFSLSIVGTVIAQRIQQAIDFRKEIEKVNIAIEKTGGTSRLTASQITTLAKNMKVTKEEALQAANAFAAFGAQSSLVLAETFKDRSSFKVFSELDKDAKTFISTVQKLFDENELGIDQAKQSLSILQKKGVAEASIFVKSLKFQEKVKKEISKQVPLQEDINAAQATFESFFDRMSGQPLKNFTLLNKERQKEILLLITAKGQMEARMGTEEERFNKKMDIIKEELRAQKELTEELERQAIIQAPKDELKALLDPLRQVDALSKSIGSSFAESFKGIVRGSMTAQEALRNLFQRTADHFLDMAAQILAAQIRSGIMGIFSNMFSGGFNRTTRILQRSQPGTLPGGFDFDSSFDERAEGGPVKRGGSFIVGERGPELFTPGVSGMITPNHALGGSTSIVVNVDASGSSVEGDEQGGRELGLVLSAAIESELIKQKRPGGLLA